MSRGPVSRRTGAKVPVQRSVGEAEGEGALASGGPVSIRTGANAPVQRDHFAARRITEGKKLPPHFTGVAMIVWRYRVVDA